MHSPVCSTVPPYLLRAIAESEVNPQHVRDTARKALAHHEHLSRARFTFLSALANNRPLIDPRVSASPRHSIVPEHLFQGIADSAENPDEERARAQRHAQHARELATRSLLQRMGDDQTPRGVGGTDLVIDCVVYDAKNSEVEMDLPGTLVRAEKDDKVADEAANQVFDNIASVLKFYSDRFQWQSIDNANMKIVSSIHFGDRYENAYWDPMRRQMVFGDGGTFLSNFTGAIDVIGHELTHAVTEFTSPLDYWGQSGALNEHVSDVFGIMVKHYVGKIKADEADWLIGEACLNPGAKGVALRSMKAPGTAYDDPRFGKDPQPAHFDGYSATDYADNGGVHKYSGIPNRAFYLTAATFGGYSYEKAGVIWWETMRSGRLRARCTFAEFADVTIDIARTKFGDAQATVVRTAWTAVGVVVKQQDKVTNGN